MLDGGQVRTGDVYEWRNHGNGKHRPALVEACRGRCVASLAGGYGHSAVVLADSLPISADDLGALQPLGALQQLAFGKDHLVVLTAHGEVFTSGKGGWGQLGHASMGEALSPMLVRKLDGRVVTQVAAGAMHSCALTDAGDVYSWGRGFEGQLGHGVGLNEAALSPRCVVGLRAAGRVLELSAGAFHCAARGEDGSVWAWGDGTSGQLGVGALLSKASTPVRVEGLPACCSVSCGYMHTAAAARGLGAYAWGLGTHGQLGFETSQPNARFATGPRKVGGELSCIAMQVVCAGNSISALLASGRVYVWGDGLADPTQLAGLRDAGKVSRLASNGVSTLVLVNTAVSAIVPACTPLEGGAPVSIFGYTFFDGF
ncbi:regulator of chromosome condensation 1/beta-lactamase-inhibitor protein II [Pavlovales sp. CCMP2436]|nr:regulator of chromosome condensation 1/beta-lactamase-inhibitor protein II [Pavlovales sp. CCMP2436]